MNNKQDNLTKKLSDARATTERLKSQKQQLSKIETVKKRSVEDYLLLSVVVISFIAAILVNGYLAASWAPANNVWVRLAIICGLVLLAIICFVLSSYGRDFKVLLKDAGVELRRVTWPTKAETIHWTWLSIVFMIVFGILVWILDLVFTQVVKFIIGG